MFAVGSGSRHVHYAYIYDVCVCVSIFTLCALSRVCMMWSKCMIVSVRFIYFIFLLDANGVRYINSKRSGVQLHSMCVFITHITPFYCVFFLFFCLLPARCLLLGMLCVATRQTRKYYDGTVCCAYWWLCSSVGERILFCCLLFFTKRFRFRIHWPLSSVLSGVRRCDPYVWRVCVCASKFFSSTFYFHVFGSNAHTHTHTV